MEGRTQSSYSEWESSYDHSNDDSGKHPSNAHSSDERRPKWRKTKETLNQDRISDLPDAILLHILSSLPTRDVVKTSMLSQRWLYLWISVQNLDFYADYRDNEYEFATFVDQTLNFHKCCKVEKFLVDFEYDVPLASRVDPWLHFATGANVEELCLRLEAFEFPKHDFYVLPQHVYTNSSIRKLNLLFCTVKPDGLISWKSLKSLLIGFIELSEELIQNILTGSPVLEYLELYVYYGFKRLDITSVCLRKLVLRDYWDSTGRGDESTLEISAPYLQSLAILGNMSRKKFRLLNVQSLVDCNLNFGLETDFHDSMDDYEEHRNLLRELLDRLGYVEKVTLGNQCIEVLSVLDSKGMLSPLSNCRCLILDTYMEEHDIPGIAGLLQSSPNLETLIINMTDFYEMTSLFDPEYDFVFDEIVFKNYLTSEKGRSKCLALHLKTVKIVGFVVGHCEFSLVIPLLQFLLEKAIVLEKIYIDAKRSPPEKLLQVAQKLQSLPRISPHAVVMCCLNDMENS